jgi:hypothetical protein
MPVYIDDYNAPFRNMIMCHMIADTREELMQMVDKIGVKRKWIQYKETVHEHFDICLQKKKLAIKEGAIEISVRELAIKINNKIEEKRNADCKAICQID